LNIPEKLKSKAIKRALDNRITTLRKKGRPNDDDDPIQRENVERFVMDHHLKEEQRTPNKGETTKPINKSNKTTNGTDVGDDTSEMVSLGKSRESPIVITEDDVEDEMKETTLTQKEEKKSSIEEIVMKE
jgi:hypothetical protein